MIAKEKNRICRFKKNDNQLNSPKRSKQRRTKNGHVDKRHASNHVLRSLLWYLQLSAVTDIWVWSMSFITCHSHHTTPAPASPAIYIAISAGND